LIAAPGGRVAGSPGTLSVGAHLDERRITPARTRVEAQARVVSRQLNAGELRAGAEAAIVELQLAGSVRAAMAADAAPVEERTD
jgi:hypothetical protein